MNQKYSPLFQPFNFPCGVQIKNRVLMAPMTTWSGNDDGTVSDAEIIYYRTRAHGVGTIITAAAYVMPQGKGFQGQIGAHTDDMIPSLKRLATIIQAQGAKAILQVYHGGRQCPPDAVPNGQAVSASAIKAEHEGAVVPREMTEDEIVQTIQAFGQATRRAIAAGFDGVEVHGANTFLVQQFFSPHANRRNDKWGGSVEKRMTFPLAVVDEVINIVAKHAQQSFIVGYRFSPEEIENPGITMDNTLQLADALADKKLDYVHVSTTNFWGGSLRDKNDQKSRPLIVAERVGDRIPVIGVGSIRTADDAIQAFETGMPLIALGRELIMEPDWLQKVQAGQEDQICTTLSKNAQKSLVIPDGLWQVIMKRVGWFPVV